MGDIIFDVKYKPLIFSEEYRLRYCFDFTSYLFQTNARTLQVTKMEPNSKLNILEQDIVDPLQAGLHIALPPARIRVTSGPRLRSESRAAPAAQTERYPTGRGVRKETRRGKWRKEGARENGENGEGGKGRRQGGQDPCGI